MDLSERERLILEALVELYVRQTGPVGSGTLQGALGVEISSATIRTVLHGLEEKGLLHQPHTSAGRVPTPEGYRVYVDHFCKPAKLPESWVRRIRSALQSPSSGADVHDVLGRVSRLLADLSSNVGVGLAVQGITSEHIQRIELVAVEGTQILVVVTLDTGVVRTDTLQMERVVDPEILDAAAQLLNEVCGDRTPSAARKHLDAALRHEIGVGSELARRVAQHKDRLFPDGSVPALHVQGVTEILEQPEFSDPENLRQLVRILDHPERLESVLIEQGQANRTLVAIGGETNSVELSPFSLVIAGCNLAGVPGYVAILGPMRMRYALALTIVKGVVEMLRSGPERDPAA